MKGDRHAIPVKHHLGKRQRPPALLQEEDNSTHTLKKALPHKETEATEPHNSGGYVV
jgi:hypothetical protein